MPLPASLRKAPLIATIALCMPISAQSNEGMWTPDQITGDLAATLRADGLKVDVRSLAKLDGPILGAVVEIPHCSGAFVSPDGLIITAYHCVTEGLQFASGEGENLIESGLNANSRDEERWVGPSGHVRLTTSMRDVTTEVLSGTSKLTGGSRDHRIEDNIKAIEGRCDSRVGEHCEVVSFGVGAEYRLITQLELKDIRIVHSPPESLGYFGGDADNWKWPRHSADFAFLRAYVGPDGNPAEHDKANVPYHPDHHLAVSQLGPKTGEFVMIAGYPGRTFRWRSRQEFEYAIATSYPRRIRTLSAVHTLFEDRSRRDRVAALALSPRMLSLSNELHYLRGNLVAVERSRVLASKAALEDGLREWIAADAGRQEEYGGLFDAMARLQVEQNLHAERDHVVDAMIRHSVQLTAAMKLYRLAQETSKPDKKRRPGFQGRDRADIAASLEQMDAGYDPKADKQVLRYFLLRAFALPEGQQVPELLNWMDDRLHGGSVERRVEAELQQLYGSTQLATSERRLELMFRSGEELAAMNDPWFKLAGALVPYLERAEEVDHSFDNEWAVLRRQYVQAVTAYLDESGSAETLYYPDANGTLRLTAGTVAGYSPSDGLTAASHTRLEGITQKATMSSFNAPDAVLSRITAAEYGPYKDSQLGSVPVNFLTTLDTGLGSSGSATLDANGRVVGILFDGNEESMASDWMYDPDMARSIHTDIRFVLWYLDTNGADAVLQELGVNGKM